MIAAEQAHGRTDARPRPTARPRNKPGTTAHVRTTTRAAGAAPLHTGDPGYSRKLDRDGDGDACE